MVGRRSAVFIRQPFVFGRLRKFDRIAVRHAEVVPLHDRLLARWMRQALRNECPFSHLSGTKAQAAVAISQFLRTAGYLAVYKEGYVQRSGRTRYLKPGGVRVIICAWPEEELLARTPAHMRRGLARSRARLCIINAAKIAVQAGLESASTCSCRAFFFMLSGVMTNEAAVEMLKGSIKKLYGRKDKIVLINIAGVKASWVGIQCPGPSTWVDLGVNGDSSATTVAALQGRRQERWPRLPQRPWPVPSSCRNASH